MAHDTQRQGLELEISREEGCMNCEFIEYRDGIKSYCSEHERYVKENDPPCKPM